jgi:hypothetical protein
VINFGDKQLLFFFEVTDIVPRLSIISKCFPASVNDPDLRGFDNNTSTLFIRSTLKVSLASRQG